jgi:IS605 OrfB family transposase
MKSPSESLERTIETRLGDVTVFPLLELLLSFFAGIRHRLFRDLISLGKNKNELKSSYIQDFHITARHFNSLAFEVSALAQSNAELRQERKGELAGKIQSTEKQIKGLQKKLKGAYSRLDQISRYRSKVKAWKEAGSRRKKPLQPPAIKRVFREKVQKDIAQHLHSIHQKKRRLGILQQRLETLKNSAAASVCFGGKALFRNQWNLKKAGFASHEEWHEAFTQKRSSHVFFVGSSDETAGNQTAQYDPEAKTLTLRLPTEARFAGFGKFLCLRNIEFPEHLRQEFLAALGAPGDGARKNQKTRQPISYRLVRRINENTGDKAYYLQATFVPEAPDIQTRQDLGVIGLDLNEDHLALAETDRFGNLVDSFILPFDLKGLSSDQTDAIIGDLSAVVVGHCLSKGKPLVIEDLDFQDKKRSLKDLPKDHRRMLSAFAYAEFKKRLHSKSRALGVRLEEVHPAYTSLIGAYKFQGFAISTHEKAAFVIARRSQGYSEDPEVFHGTRPAHELMQEKLAFKRAPRHVWGFYADHQGKIRELFMSEKKRRLCPSVRALSLAKTHPSLFRSYEAPGGRIREILDRQNPEALDRVSG